MYKYLDFEPTADFDYRELELLRVISCHFHSFLRSIKLLNLLHLHTHMYCEVLRRT